ncbi:MAG: serine/threonine protein kinase [Kofleriaceae bacterium]|nr:serine/threonine protein kinase [Kofleriaceae bacterium]
MNLQSDIPTVSVEIESGLPQVFGRYLLVQRLSRGGMGEIFLAKHGLAGFEKLAVIKKVLPHLAQDAQFISRFVDEAQVAIKLQHVNIAQVFEVGRVGDEYFLALEYIEGRDLRRLFSTLAQRAMRMPTALALYVARELANGLAYAHRRTAVDGSSLNLVHCDISPPNIVVSFEGEIKVIDFGIAKSALRGTATDPKMGFGKFGYMAPEQLIRGGIVDHRTDIYAAGVVLFELLAGERLYRVGESPDYRALARMVSKGEHKVPSDIDPELAPFDDIVSICLAPQPEDRYQNAADMRDALASKLAVVNPTMSTDQLGTFLRELFSEDLALQREMNARIAATHLDDFQDAFSTQAVQTVSFASAVGAGGALARRRRTTQLPPLGHATPSPLLARDATAMPPVAPVVTVAAAPLPRDHSEPAAETSPTFPRRTRFNTVVVVAIVATAIVGGVYAMTRDSTERPVPQPAVIDAGPGPHVASSVVMTSLLDAAPAVMPLDAAPPVAVVDASPRNPGLRPARVVDAKPKDPMPTLSHEQVMARFQSAVREYTAFKTKYGMRLDSEWNDLAQLIQYISPANYYDAVRKIDAFRARMKAADIQPPP